MKKLFAVIGMQVLYYLLWSFIIGDFLSMSNTYGAQRFFYVFLSVPIIGMSIWIYADTPDFLKEKTHEEKKTGLKKYIGDLHEELALYGEAMELEKKIREFKSKK